MIKWQTVETTLNPTHTCFDDAVEMIEEFLRTRRFLPGDLFLIHAIVAPDGMKDSSHAWVETKNDTAFFNAILKNQKVIVECRASEYRKELNVKASTSYSVKEALDMNKLHGTYGPWKKEYIALCRIAKTLKGDSK